MTDTSGSPKGVEADLWTKPEKTINEKIKDLCPIVITTIDCRAKDGNKYEFDKNIEGDENNDYAHFFTNVGVARKEGGWFSSGYNVFEGTDIKKMKIMETINQVAEERKATHCMLYVHGYSTQPQSQINAAMEINAHWEGKGAFCIPVVWPAEKIAYWTQKADANGAARGLREEILPYLKHECGTKVSISIMCHSMGNYVLKKMAPEENVKGAFQFDNIFMVAADVRAVTFDEKKGVEEVTVTVNGKKQKVLDHDGKDIARLAKHKIHVCWYGGDLALLGRRAEVWSNRGRAAIGRNGLYEYSKEEDLIDHKGKLCEKKCDGWNNQQDSWAKRRLGHNYQTEEDALEYYRLEMKNNCDNKC